MDECLESVKRNCALTQSTTNKSKAFDNIQAAHFAQYREFAVTFDKGS